MKVATHYTAQSCNKPIKGYQVYWVHQNEFKLYTHETSQRKITKWAEASTFDESRTCYTDAMQTVLQTNDKQTCTNETCKR